MTVSLSYVLMKAAFTSVIAGVIWYGWMRLKRLPNAEKSALQYGAMLFVALAVVFYVFEWLT